MGVAEILPVVAVIAAALAIWKGLLEAVRWLRRRRVRYSLKRRLIELYALDRELCEVVVEADHRLVEGPGWSGWAIWPDRLAPLLDRLLHLTLELDGMRARTRAQWAEGPSERLRDDIEQLVTSLRKATSLYMRGIIQKYRENEGKPFMWSASGRALTHTLTNEDAREEVEQLKRTAQLLFRSSAYQLGLKDAAERDVALWPLEERHSLYLSEQRAR